MTAEKAIEHWNYDPRKLERLKDICRKNPRRYMKGKKINIPEDASPIYIPDRRIRSFDSHYMHIITAIARQQELLPNAIQIKQEAFEAYMNQLKQANLILPINAQHADMSTTNYILCLGAESWLSKRSKEKHALLFDALKILAPRNNE